MSEEWTASLQVLGLSGAVTRAQIQAAYRRLARAFHPDLNREGARRFREATEAYRTLEELWRMREAGESADLFQAVLLDPLFAKIGTGRLKSRLRDCPLWQVRASAAAALGLRGEERIEEALAAARRDPEARVRDAARRVLAQLSGPRDLGRLLRGLARGAFQPLGAQ
jgi:curved DNA-binding protein CbpA